MSKSPLLERIPQQIRVKSNMILPKCNKLIQQFPILINPIFYSCLRTYQENLEQLQQVCPFLKRGGSAWIDSDHGGSQAPDDSVLLNHVDFIDVERVKFPELCWNSTDSSNSWETNQKFHTLTWEVGQIQIAWLPIVICWENNMCANVCSIYKQDVICTESWDSYPWLPLYYF